METRFYRPSDDRLISGVCSGIANGFELDPTLIRLLWVLVTFFGGSGIVAYLVAWVIMPDESGERAATPVVLLVLILGLPLLCALCIGTVLTLGGLLGSIAN